jgi:hypothetical protein
LSEEDERSDTKDKDNLEDDEEDGLEADEDEDACDGLDDGLVDELALYNFRSALSVCTGDIVEWNT